MSNDEFVDLVSRLRDAQKNYFRVRTADALEGSKRLERDVDKAIEEMRSRDRQPTLFT
jgi:hypothetical protein